MKVPHPATSTAARRAMTWKDRTGDINRGGRNGGRKEGGGGGIGGGWMWRWKEWGEEGRRRWGEGRRLDVEVEGMGEGGGGGGRNGGRRWWEWKE
ncbi:hypothetical protein Pmani_024646 [Petrolisthes manimaculis]|uniref:Uncharacterized protein n=1 Tax=Petrolisthes manimaculis TaxID=1843537 RepID=A0AAE1P8T7_9EUCA|nr:hypothetical protein Pmani_024646 [Petrolisthes manimaculis]